MEEIVIGCVFVVAEVETLRLAVGAIAIERDEEVAGS